MEKVTKPIVFILDRHTPKGVRTEIVTTSWTKLRRCLTLALRDNEWGDALLYGEETDKIGSIRALRADLKMVDPKDQNSARKTLAYIAKGIHPKDSEEPVYSIRVYSDGKRITPRH